MISPDLPPTDSLAATRFTIGDFDVSFMINVNSMKTFQRVCSVQSVFLFYFFHVTLIVRLYFVFCSNFMCLLFIYLYAFWNRINDYDFD